MNKAIKITGFIVLFFAGLGTLFKMLFWPLGNFMFALGIVVLLIGFLPLFGIHRFRTATGIAEKVAIVAGVIALMLFFQGYLFKIQHWPGAYPSIVTGMYLLCLLALPLYVFSEFRTSEKKVPEIIKMVFTALTAIVLMFFISVNYSRNILDTFTSVTMNQQLNSLSMEHIIAKYDTLIKADSNSDGELLRLNRQFAELNLFIGEIKTKLISEADGKSSVPEEFNNPDLIMAKDNTDVPNFVMIGSAIGSKYGKGVRLREKISELREHMISFIKSSDLPSKNEMISNIDELLSTQVRTIYGKSEPWEVYMFYNTPLIGTITLLNNIQNNIRTADLMLKSGLVFRTKNIH